MASSYVALSFMALVLTQAVQGALGHVTCEDLDRSTCAFAVSSTGTRCVLEKQMTRAGQKYTCRSSEIEANKLTDWIESDECLEACGLDRNTVGISSDALLESQFTQKLCSPKCYQNCPNVVDLYFNLAAGEGVFLPKLCEAQGTNSRRAMAEIRSSGLESPSPTSTEASSIVAAPLIAPAMPPV